MSNFHFGGSRYRPSLGEMVTSASGKSNSSKSLKKLRRTYNQVHHTNRRRCSVPEICVNGESLLLTSTYHKTVVVTGSGASTSRQCAFRSGNRAIRRQRAKSVDATSKFVTFVCFLNLCAFSSNTRTYCVTYSQTLKLSNQLVVLSSLMKVIETSSVKECIQHETSAAIRSLKRCRSLVDFLCEQSDFIALSVTFMIV